MMTQKAKVVIVIVVLLALAAIIPHSSSFVVLLATRALVFAILAMSVDLLLGFTGESGGGRLGRARPLQVAHGLANEGGGPFGRAAGGRDSHVMIHDPHACEDHLRAADASFGEPREAIRFPRGHVRVEEGVKELAVLAARLANEFKSELLQCTPAAG